MVSEEAPGPPAPIKLSDLYSGRKAQEGRRGPAEESWGETVCWRRYKVEGWGRGGREGGLETIAERERGGGEGGRER